MTNTEDFRNGQTVESKLTANKFGTVVQTFSGDGKLEIRWDGDTKSVILPATRVKPKKIEALRTSLPYKDEEDQEFQRGDYIEVVTQKFGTVRGAALTEWVRFGWATFEILTEDGDILSLNSNYDKHKVIFRADIARGLTPTY